MDEQDIKNIIAENITALRTRAGMTQLELAGKLNYSDKSVSKWERGESVPDIYILKNIADIFGVSVDYLLIHHKKVKYKKALSYNNIMLVTVLGILLLSLAAFIALWLCGIIYWQLFIYALPVCTVTLICLDSVFYKGKHNMLLVSLLILFSVLTVYIIFIKQNFWQLFLLLIPGELIAFLCFRLKKK